MNTGPTPRRDDPGGRVTRIAIAGAGIAGLATALALRQVGVEVSLIERRAVLDETGAGLQLSPNATRCLGRLGVLDSLLADATRPEAVRIRRGHDAADLAQMPLGAFAVQRYGAPFILMHRADLQRRLVAAVTRDLGIDLRLGTSVDRVDDDATGMTLRSGDGTHVAADAFVAASGVHRTAVAEAPARQRRNGRTAWRALVPAEAVPDRFRRPESNLWLGARVHVVHYPLRGARLVNVVVITDDDAAEAASPDPWARQGDPAVLRRHLRHWHVDITTLTDAATAWRTWPLLDGTAGQRWSHRRRTAVGDAAHPMLPFLAQGASQAIEDAAALANAVAARPDDLPGAFAAYERLRRPQAERVQTASRRQGQVYHLAGPAAFARDLAMNLLGPQRMLSRMDWIYAPGSTAASTVRQ